MIYNFSAGPAMLPPEVLQQAAQEMSDWRGCGISVMEMSHRSSHYDQIHQQALADFRTLLNVPANYRVLFMQGGGLGQNAIVPLNLCGKQRDAIVDVVVSGGWSAKSAQEAHAYARVNVVAQPEKFTVFPDCPSERFSTNAAYAHVCTNETVHGVEVLIEDARARGAWGLAKEGVVVADMSSHILSRPIDFTQYGVIFAGAQKNIGCAGLTIVVVRDDLLDRARADCPSAFHWQTVAAQNSLYNTPPTYAIYIAGLVFQWLLKQGGVAAMAARNQVKAQLLYDTIDASALYFSSVDPQFRSRMNVPFFLRNDNLNAAFLDAAKEAGLLSLKGHKSLGGMRASIYNAMPIEGVRALVEMMRHFEQRFF